MNLTKPTKERGRPRAFNSEDVLDKALKVFWRRGYEGASMAEITHAMGINRPSIYATFGNKEELFCKVLEKYLSGPVAYVTEAMHEPTARQVAEKLLTKSAEFLTTPNSPQSCLINTGTLTCGEESEPIMQLLIAYRKGYENALRQRFELAQTQSDLPQDINPSELAKYIVTIHQGLSVQATSGATRKELMAVIKIALSTWPSGN